jgi:hypothetical protein
VERIQGAVVLSRAMADRRCFANMASELPDQLLAGADRSTVWTTRVARLPPAPSPHSPTAHTPTSRAS